MIVGASLSRAEWIVLALIVEQPRHGFAVAALTRRAGDLGRVWVVPLPIVYRAIQRLLDHGLIVATSVEEGERGPSRTVYAPAEDAVAEVHGWLDTPAAHVRDFRSETLVKLALLLRGDRDPRPLLAAQVANLAPIRHGLEARRSRDSGFERVLTMWRLENVEATLRVLDTLLMEHADHVR